MAVTDPTTVIQWMSSPDPTPLYWMTLLSRLSYNHAVTTIERGLGYAGSGRAVRSASPDPTLPTWFVGLYPDWAVVSVAGTPPEVGTWIGNIFGSAEQSLAPFPGMTHSYFGAVASVIAEDMAVRLAASWPLQNVLLIGHSLGGAVANLLPWSLVQAGTRRILGVCTFGAPRSGDLEFATAAPWQGLRLVNVGDVVTDLPPSTAAQLGSLADIPAWGPCDNYVNSGIGYAWNYAGGLGPATGNSAGDIFAALIGGVLDQGIQINAIAHYVANYALRCRRWMGTNFPPASTRGIDVVGVDEQQQSLSEAEGFDWSP